MSRVVRGRRTSARAARAVFVLVTTFAVALTPCMASAESRDGTYSEASELRVATFNIHHGAGTDDELDLAHTADVIKSNGMDVVGLQEVDRHWGERSDFVDQAEWLAEQLDMHVTFGPNISEPGDGEQVREFGNAVLSTFPIEDSRNIELPRPEGTEQRGLLEAELDVDGAPVHFYSTHLGHESTEARLAQVDAVNEILADVDRPSVLTGDLNAEPKTTEIKRLSEHLDDTWPIAGSGDGYTFEPEKPRKRIDYVFASEEIKATSAEVLDTKASDHLPVVVDVAVSG